MLKLLIAPSVIVRFAGKTVLIPVLVGVTICALAGRTVMFRFKRLAVNARLPILESGTMLFETGVLSARI